MYVGEQNVIFFKSKKQFKLKHCFFNGTSVIFINKKLNTRFLSRNKSIKNPCFYTIIAKNYFLLSNLGPILILFYILNKSSIVSKDYNNYKAVTSFNGFVIL